MLVGDTLVGMVRLHRSVICSLGGFRKCSVFSVCFLLPQNSRLLMSPADPRVVFKVAEGLPGHGSVEMWAAQSCADGSLTLAFPA